MAARGSDWTIGVEEEYQIVDAATRALQPGAKRILPDAQEALGEQAQHELYLSQVESATPVCRTLADVRREVVRARRAVTVAAAKEGHRIAAAGTHPFSHWAAQQLTPKARYEGIALDYQQLADEAVIFGCHVHVGLGDREAAVQVMNRVRPWLAPLLALSANSPFWLGSDTGYASFRTQLWGRFPMAGPPHLFASRTEHDALVRALVATGSIEDATKIYWDVRLPERVETIEFRVTDVCMTVDEAVMVAGLVRGLARTCYEAALREEPFPAVRPELLRSAHWRAARHGLDGDLIDVAAERSVPAHELIGTLLPYVRPALEEMGDWDEVSTLVQETLRHGTGAQRQREAYARAGRLEDVVDLIVAETARGVDPAGR